MVGELNSIFMQKVSSVYQISIHSSQVSDNAPFATFANPTIQKSKVKKVKWCIYIAPLSQRLKGALQ